jgi:hypothetical protein
MLINLNDKIILKCHDGSISNFGTDFSFAEIEYVIIRHTPIILYKIKDDVAAEAQREKPKQTADGWHYPNFVS